MKKVEKNEEPIAGDDACRPKKQEPRLFPRITRDTVLFTSGLTLIFYEAVIRDGTERPSLIILYAGMVGLPGVLRFAEAIQGNRQ